MSELNSPLGTTPRRPISRHRLAGLALVAVGALVVSLLGAAPAMAEPYQQTIHSQVDYLPASGGSFVGSPSMVVLPDGDILSKHDVFGPSSSSNVTHVFRSTDGGTSWHEVAGSPVQPLFWATIFHQHGNVYLMGTAGAYKDAVIYKSNDNGEHWSGPTVLLHGTYHTGDTPVLRAHGRIYKTYEHNLHPPGWAQNFQPVVMSAPENADLSEPASWTVTNEAPVQSVLEGNPVEGPDGTVYDILRQAADPTSAFVTKVSPDNKTLSVVGKTPFPYGVSVNKFFITYDKASDRYLMAGNPQPLTFAAHNLPAVRNVLALYESQGDPFHWKYVRTLIEDDQNISWNDSLTHTAFSQPTLLIEGDDLLVASRTAYDGAANYHNSNRLTVHRFTHFRQYLPPNDEVAAYTFDDRADPGTDGSRSSDKDAKLSAGAQLVTGKRGLALDAGTGYLDLRHMISPIIDGAGAVSVSAWVKPRTLPKPGVQADWIFGSRIDGPAAGIDLMFNGHSIEMGGRSGSGDAYQSMLFPYPNDDSWHHVAAVFDYANDRFQLFLDGKPEQGAGNVKFANPGYTFGVPSQPDRVGASPNGDGAFDGLIDEVHIVKGAVGAAQIGTEMNGPSPAPTDILVNGHTVPGFNPTTHRYDVTVPTKNDSVEVTMRSPKTDKTATLHPKVGQDLTATFDLQAGTGTQTYYVNVLRQRAPSPDASLRSIGFARLQAPRLVSGVYTYDTDVTVADGQPVDLTVADPVPSASAYGATATIVEQPAMKDAVPTARVRVQAENGDTQVYLFRFHVQHSPSAGSWSFDHLNGDVTKDSSLFGTDGKVIGATAAPGAVNSALHFDGQSRVDLGTGLGAHLAGASAVSLSAWIYNDALPASDGTYQWLFGTRLGGGAAGFEVMLNGHHLQVAGRSQIGDPYGKALFDYDLVGQWHHITATVDYGHKQISLYIDGMQQKPSTGSGAATFGSSTYQYAGPGQPDTIGMSPAGVGGWQGRLDEVSIYAHAVTPSSGPSVIAVPPAPVMHDNCGLADDTVDLPKDTATVHWEYVLPHGNHMNKLDTVQVRAVAAKGYVFSSGKTTHSWNLHFTNKPCALPAPPAWDSSAVYTSGDRVSLGDKVWQASWWTRNQKPGDPTGPWQEIAPAGSNGVAAWTASRIYTLGNQVSFQGATYTAKWWTRNQAPGDTNGPWASK